VVSAGVRGHPALRYSDVRPVSSGALPFWGFISRSRVDFYHLDLIQIFRSSLYNSRDDFHHLDLIQVFKSSLDMMCDKKIKWNSESLTGTPKPWSFTLCPQQTTGTNIKKLRDDTEPLHVRAEHSEIVRFLRACYRHRDRGCKLSVLCNLVQPQSDPSALVLLLSGQWRRSIWPGCHMAVVCVCLGF
jgi:hypothetical protein